MTDATKQDRPTIVVLCGSTRFRDAYEAAMRTETLAGKIVLTVGLFGHVEGLDMDGPVKAMLDQLHLRKIDRADEALFLNFGGYIGASTQRELDYARLHGKRIRFLEPREDERLTMTAEETNARLIAADRDLLEACQAVLARTVLATRWPCPDCGRRGPHEELRILEVLPENADQAFLTGCWRCNSDDLREMVSRAIKKATGERTDE
jgi:hypothetical protein